MTDGETCLQGLIDRMKVDDESARRELVSHAYQRLCRLAAGLQRAFPILKEHEPESVIHTAWERLDRAIRQSPPPTVADLFRLAAYVIHQVLLDLAEQHRKRLAREGASLGHGSPNDPSNALLLDPGHDSWDPVRLAVWREFHDQVVRLPEEERSVFELHYYIGLTQAEIARLLDRHPRAVSRLWIAATERLADQVPDVTRLF